MTDEKYYTLRREEQVDRMIREIKRHTGIRRSEQVIRYVLDLYYFQVIRRYRPESSEVESEVRNDAKSEFRNQKSEFGKKDDNAAG